MKYHSPTILPHWMVLEVYIVLRIILLYESFSKWKYFWLLVVTHHISLLPTRVTCTAAAYILGWYQPGSRVVMFGVILSTRGAAVIFGISSPTPSPGFIVQFFGSLTSKSQTVVYIEPPKFSRLSYHLRPWL